RNRALCNVDRRKYDAALADYARALELDPKEPANWYQRGALYQIQQRWQDAEADFSKAIELDSNLAFGYMNRGVVRYRQGNRSGAEEDLMKARGIDSSIVIPDIGFFSELPAGSVTESSGHGVASLWISVKTVAEQDLATRGASDIMLTREFPDRRCGEFRATMNGKSRTVVVAVTERGTFDVPAQLLTNETAQQSDHERSLMLISPGTGSAESPSVTLFQPDWQASAQSARNSLFEFAAPEASTP
ncbi:MAG: tetratricopeptide repeat protein, partial [Planctomycetota bacterium]